MVREDTHFIKTWLCWI